MSRKRQRAPDFAAGCSPEPYPQRMRCVVPALLLVFCPLGAAEEKPQKPAQKPAGKGLSVRPPGVSRAVQKTIDRGLGFLAREQRGDGSWWSNGGYGGYPVTMTSLAGLALVASGSTPSRGPFARHVRRAVAYCLSQQAPNGLIARTDIEARPMYSHGFAMLFLGQVFGMEEDLTRQRRIRDALRRGIQLTARAQSRDGGWDYTPDSRRDEGSVTITQVQGLRACRNAGLHVPKSVIQRAIRYIERSQQPDGGIAYRLRSRGSLPAITAAACAVLYNAGKFDSPAGERAFRYAWKTCQPQTNSSGHYFYQQLYFAQAVWQKGGGHWKKYYPALQRSLLRLQNGNGSWRGDAAGLVFGTAVATLVLQLPHNKLPILSR